MNKSDQFELKIELQDPSGTYGDEPESYLITQSVYINGENIAPDNPIDLVLLAKSCQLSGEFFIVTCDCGDAGCAGIDDGIRVSHFSDQIVWEVPDPLSYRGMTREEAEFVSENRTYRRYVFEPQAYLASIQNGLANARKFLKGNKQPVELSRYGFESADLLGLDPIVFSERGAPLGCRIVGRTLKVGRSAGWVTINEIHYRLRELPVPDNIKALGDWSDWGPKPWKNGYLFGDAAAPESERQRRVQLLEKYLASIRVN